MMTHLWKDLKYLAQLRHCLAQALNLMGNAVQLALGVARQEAAVSVLRIAQVV
jgi:hypothetical protein